MTTPSTRADSCDHRARAPEVDKLIALREEHRRRPRLRRLDATRHALVTASCHAAFGRRTPTGHRPSALKASAPIAWKLRPPSVSRTEANVWSLTTMARISTGSPKLVESAGARRRDRSDREESALRAIAEASGHHRLDLLLFEPLRPRRAAMSPALLEHALRELPRRPGQ
jgi:hypothetical protein